MPKAGEGRRSMKERRAILRPVLTCGPRAGPYAGAAAGAAWWQQGCPSGMTWPSRGFGAGALARSVVAVATTSAEGATKLWSLGVTCASSACKWRGHDEALADPGQKPRVSPMRRTSAPRTRIARL